MEKVKPIVLENKENGKRYTLEFTRTTVKMAENAGFTLDAITSGKLVSGYSNLFFFAFMAHHRYMKQEETDRILFDELGGMTEALSTRLIELFAVPYNALVAQEGEDGEDGEKNGAWSVEL